MDCENIDLTFILGVQRITGVGFGQAPSYPSYEHGWGGQTGVNNVLASAAKQGISLTI